MFNYPDFDKSLIEKGRAAEAFLKPVFDRIDSISEANQYKVLMAFQKNRVSEMHFNSSSGYGYNDLGRDCLERLYADIFHTEDALVRPQITCGTHAIYLSMQANLLPGDEIVFISGMPYDSLKTSIGIEPAPCSLAEYGVTWKVVELKDEKEFDFEEIKKAISDKTKMVAIQRSKGYKTRESLSPEQIGKACAFVKKLKPDIIVNVDNCYGEFVELTEPTDYGVDLCVGSLIKNPGGGLAPIGGYIVGKKEYVERCAYRLTAPGLGKEVGASLGILKSLYMGLSLAPGNVANALKNAHFAAYMFEKAGYKTYPSSDSVHHCIVQAIEFGSPDKVNAFCEAVQKSSYVDSFVTPEGWDMPGYQDNIIMASGSFVSGSSIEISADGPMREPYVVYFQGGLTFEQGKYAVLSALNSQNF